MADQRRTGESPLLELTRRGTLRRSELHLSASTAEMDPDLRIREALSAVFKKFAELRSVR